MKEKTFENPERETCFPFLAKKWVYKYNNIYDGEFVLMENFMFGE